MNGEKNGRGSTWDDKEIFLLINIWGEERIQEKLDSCVHKRPVFEKMAKCLAEQGFERTHKQINEKIKQLKKKYKQIKDANNVSGSGRKTWKFFNVVDEILGDRPISTPSYLFEIEDESGQQGEEEESGVLVRQNSETTSGEEISLESTQNDEDLQDKDALIQQSFQLRSSTPLSSSMEITDAVGHELNTLQPHQEQPNCNIIEEKEPKKGMVLSSRKGKSKKRSRSEMQLSNALTMTKEHQKEADERFFKMEEARNREELEIEEKRRREDRAHEIYMMQMMRNMFMEAASALTIPVPMQHTQCYQTQPGRLNNSVYEQNSQNYPRNFNESDKGSHFTSL